MELTKRELMAEMFMQAMINENGRVGLSDNAVEDAIQMADWLISGLEQNDKGSKK